ncbi:MAG: kelch repeat-containing protein, partial [Xanthobacteraceae bacterium]
MLLLTDGTVMVHELNTSHWHRLTPDSSGNYVNGSWSTLASLPDNNGIPASKGGPTNAPLYFASAVLGDGTVFVAGGENNTGKQDADILTAQIYDPLSDTWTPIATPPGWTGIGDAPTCALPDGRLLIGSFESNANALFDPKTQIWQAGGTKADSCSEETFTLMPNGNVLTVECSNAPNAEQYIPSSNTWVSASSTPATLPQACPGFVPEIGPAILLPDGRVFAIGATGATALYTPDPDPTIAGTWAGGPSLVDAHGNPSFPMDTPATLLPNGKVLLASAPGPPCNYPSPTTFFLYDPSTNTASVETSPSNGDGSPYGGRMLLLPTGQVMYSANRKDMEVYTPDAGGDPSWKPAIINFPDTLIVGGTHTISGTQFNGLSQACSYGDDAQMATNYP